MRKAPQVTIFFQFRPKTYNPGLYWIVVVLISIAGTLFTDNLTDNLNVSLMTSSLVWAVLLASAFRKFDITARTITTDQPLRYY